MPQAVRYYAPGTPERKDLDLAGDKERKARSKQYDMARKYFDGLHDRQLDQKEGEPDDNVVINLVKMSIERQSSFLFPDMPKFELDMNTTEETPDEKWLRECFEENGGLHFMHELAETSGLMGHVFVRVRNPNAQQVAKFPRFVNLDPRKIVTFWHAEDMEYVIFHELRWEISTREKYIQDIIFLENLKQWRIDTYKTTTNNHFELVDSVKWRFPYGPIVHWPHLPNPHEFYGRSDFSTADKFMQDSINLMYSEMARINRYHSSPRTIIIGADAASIQPTAIDHAWTIENENAKVTNLEMSSDLQSARSIAIDLNDLYLYSKRVVVLKGQVKDFQRVTNAGVRTVFLDMIAKNIVLLSTFKRGLRDMAFRATLIDNAFKEPLMPTIVMRDPLPTDMKEIADIMAIERAGKLISHESASTRLGNVWTDELKKMTEEFELEVLNPMSQVQTQLGGAIQDKQNSQPDRNSSEEDDS